MSEYSTGASVTTGILNYLTAANVTMLIGGVPASVSDSMGSETITLVADAGFVFEDDPEITAYIKYSGYDPWGDPIQVKYPTSLNVAKTEAVIVTDYRTIVSIFAETVAAASETPFLEIDSGVVADLEAAEVELYRDDVLLGLGDVINTGDTVKAVSTNYLLGFYENQDGNTSINFTYYDLDDSETKALNFTLLNFNEAECLVDIANDFEDVVLNVDTSDFNPEVLGGNKLFLVDNADVQEINDRRFGAPTEPSGLPVDNGVFILNLLQIPFEIDPKYIGESEEVVLGTNETGYSCPAIIDDVITYDLGEITVSGSDGNFLDFDEVECILHLPNAAPITLDPRYVIDQTINIEYLVSVYTGDATINVYSTKTGEVIQTAVAELCTDVPYIQTYRPEVSNLNATLSGDNGLLSAYIEVVKKDALLVGDLFTVPIIDAGKLLNETGFILVEETNLNFQALASEKDSIRQALQGGVIINE